MAVYRCVRASPHQRGVRDAGGFVVRQRDSVRKILRSSRRVRQISAVASAIRSHYIGAAGLRGASGDTSPGPYRSLRELSLTGPVGSDIWRPPTFVGNPGSSSPTAIAAPHMLHSNDGLFDWIPSTPRRLS